MLQRLRVGAVPAKPATGSAKLSPYRLLFVRSFPSVRSAAMADDALPLDAKAELAGEWWQPDDAEATAYGLLTYTPEDGLLLRLTSGRQRSY
jgi:hypothetical protein